MVARCARAAAARGARRRAAPARPPGPVFHPHPRLARANGRCAAAAPPTEGGGTSVRRESTKIGGLPRAYSPRSGTICGRGALGIRTIATQNFAKRDVPGGPRAHLILYICGTAMALRTAPFRGRSPRQKARARARRKAVSGERSIERVPRAPARGEDDERAPTVRAAVSPRRRRYRRCDTRRGARPALRHSARATRAGEGAGAEGRGR